MKKALFFVLLFLNLDQTGLFSLDSEKLLSPSGVPVELLYKAFLPGEIVTVAIKEKRNVEESQIRFLGRKYVLGKGKSPHKLLAFVGLDLSLKPGSYMMKICIKNSEGTWEYIHKEIPVLVKEFPEKRLWVEERYVTPPPEVQERIRREADILKVVYAIFTPMWLGEGRFIIPSSGRSVNNFGERRIYNNKPRSSHSGVDISASSGTPVKASNSGRIVLASDLYFAGKTVIIDHGLGLFTLYCHFSKIRVKRGNLIKKGEIIGEVGATGRVTGAHLHWGVRIFGNRVDPYSLLSLALE